MALVIRIVLSVVILTISNSCSVLVNIYAKNSSDQTFLLRLVTRPGNTVQSFVFPMSRDVERIRYRSFDNFAEQVKADTQGSQIDVHLPANSTIYIGPEAIVRQTFASFVICKVNQCDTILTENPQNNKLFKYTGSVNKYAAWLELH